MRLPVYVSGASAEHARVRKWADALEKSGAVKLTHRWFEDAAKWTGSDALHPHETRLQLAQEELRGIRAARVYWLILPATMAGGSMFEWGYAYAGSRKLGNSLTTIVSGPNVADTIFSSLAHEAYEMDVQGYQSVLAHAKRAAGTP
jgi:hypothetical protein